MSVIYLVRHGQASADSDDYDQLTELGFEQSRILGAALRSRVSSVDAVFTGTLRRQRETASTCLGAMGMADVERRVLPALDEYDHDEVTYALVPRWRDRQVRRAELARSGEPKRAYQEVFEPAVKRWTSGEHDADYPEAFSVFHARCEAALRELVTGLGRSKTAFVFTSGGPIAIVMGTLLGLREEAALRLQWRLVNTGVSKIVIGRTGPAVASLNEHGHLEVEPRRLITYR